MEFVAPPVSPSSSRVPPVLQRLYRWFTPLRLLCFALLGLAGYGMYILGPMAVLLQLLIIPPIALAVDGILAYVRWGSFRFPWAGLATGLFVALLIPPQGAIGPFSDTTILLAGVAVTVIALLAKHTFRTRNHPWFNPAALAIVFAGVLFGITPAWWGAISIPAVVIAGVLIALRQPRRWQIPVTFFASYSALTIAGSFLTTGVPDPHVVLLDLIDPSLLFFTFLMVTEPRTSVANPQLQPAFGLAAGLLAGLFRLVLNGTTSLAASENLLLALLGANLVAVGVRSLDARARAERAAAEPSTRRSRPVVRSTRSSWGWGHTAGAALLMIILIGVSWGTAGSPQVPAAGPPPKVVVVSCSQDNRTIPAADLTMLHRTLGPSVIFSYDKATGATVFYDPVNHVTIYETDLFEDFGTAEFNGDDQVLANGCSLGAA